MDQITQEDKESFIDKKNRIASVGKSDVGKKILTSKEKNNNKRISSLTGTKSQIRQYFFFQKPAEFITNWKYNTGVPYIACPCPLKTFQTVQQKILVSIV